MEGLGIFDSSKTGQSQLQKLGNGILTIIVYFALVFAFGIRDEILAIVTVAFAAMLLLRVNYALGTILTCYILLPSDFYSLMMVSSPFGNFPIYILLFLIFIVLNVICFGQEANNFRVDKGFLIAFIMLILSQTICCMLYGNNSIVPNAVKFLTQIYAMMLLVKNTRMDEAAVKRLYQYLFVLCCIGIFIAVQEGMFGLNVYRILGGSLNAGRYDWDMFVGSIWRTSSTFGNSLVFSCTMLMCLPAVEYYRRNGKVGWIAYIATGVLAAGIVLSGSRSGILGIAIYVVYIFAVSGKGRLAACIVIPVVAYALFNLVDVNTIMERFSTQGLTSAHRSNAYMTFFDVFLDYFFFGTGLGNSYSVLAEYISESFTTNTLDNTFMDGTLALGIWGVSALILMFRSVKRRLRANEGKIWFPAICFIFLSFFLNGTKYQSLWGLLWFYIAIQFYHGKELSHDIGIDEVRMYGSESER